MIKKYITVLSAAVLSVTVSAKVQADTITVKKGDTLWDLSRNNDTTVENTKMLNNLTTDLIHPGDVLTITPEKHYLVKKGDTLWDIAKIHGVTVSQIKEWNNLNTDIIHPDLNLLIFEGAKNIARSEITKTSNSAENTLTTPSKPASSKTAVAPKESASTPKETASAPKESAPAPKERASAPKESVSKPKEQASSKVIKMEATAYTASCKGCSGITATGINLIKNPNLKVISVDPSVIPLGSKVYVEGYGKAIAGDTGGGIKGNRIDVFIPNKQDAINFGRKQVNVTILN